MNARTIVPIFPLILVVLGLASCATLPESLMSALSPPAPTIQNRSAATFDPQSVSKIAVLVDPVRESRLGRNAARMIEDEVILALLDRGYSVAARSDVESLLKEQRFQQSGLTDQDASRLGKLLNVQAVLIASLTDFRVERSRGGLFADPKARYYDTTASMGMRIIDTETGEILWLGRHRSGITTTDSRGDEGPGLVTRLARLVASSVPAR